jgi:hypothetical protein
VGSETEAEGERAESGEREANRFRGSAGSSSVFLLTRFGSRKYSLRGFREARRPGGGKRSAAVELRLALELELGSQRAASCRCDGCSSQPNEANHLLPGPVQLKSDLGSSFGRPPFLPLAARFPLPLLPASLRCAADELGILLSPSRHAGGRGRGRSLFASVSLWGTGRRAKAFEWSPFSRPDLSLSLNRNYYQLQIALWLSNLRLPPFHIALYPPSTTRIRWAS